MKKTSAEAVIAVSPDEVKLSDLELAELKAIRERIARHLTNLGDVADQFERHKVALINAVTAERQQHDSRIGQIVEERKLGWSQCDVDLVAGVLRRKA